MDGCIHFSMDGKGPERLPGLSHAVTKERPVKNAAG